MDIILKENERIDDLQLDGLKIIQNKNKFCFGVDSVLLSDFARDIKQNSTVLDLGTGTGIIATLLCSKTKLNKIIGVEIQEEIAEMASRSIKLNHLEHKFELLNEDLNNLFNYYSYESIDAIVTNPPYKQINTGIQNEDYSKLISRHEVACNLEQIASISSKLLKNKGAFYMVHRAERLLDILAVLKKFHLEPKKLQFAFSKNGDSQAKLVLIKAIKNGNSFLKIEKIEV